MGGVGRRRRRRAGRVLVVVVVVLALGGAAGAAAGFGSGLRGGDGGSGKGSGLPPATAKVTRQTLLDTQTEDGDLGYGDETKLAGRLTGTVTALPAPGSVVKRGEALYRVDNTPVVLLYGSLPAYRALAPNTAGPDVKQFEQNLYDLGYRGFTVDEKYSDTTATAVKKWQKDLGLPQTGSVDLGRVVYAAGVVRVSAQKAAVGDSLGGPDATVLTYTGTARVVTVELDVSDARLVHAGAAVGLKLPNGKTTTGKITKSQTVIKPAEGNNPASTKLEVFVSVDDETTLADLDQATVDVAFTASQRENVLTVPVAALLALAEGGYGVQVVDGSHTRIVAVQTGLFAGGRVEVTGTGLTEGQTVGMPS
jgi:peptidoglycan hydrolase-like protein with peptidoglycan-binding domain